MRRMTKRMFSLLLTAGLVLGMLPAAFGAEGFQDVKDSDWFSEAVTEMTEAGYMNGVAEGVFNPQGTATRGMLVTVIWRTEGCVKPSHGAVCKFPDVTEEWNKTAIMWMTDSDTIQGYPDGTFQPNKALTRAEAAKIIGYAASSYDYSGAGEKKMYKDQDQIPEWAQYWVEECQVRGILSGYPDGTFRPNQTITRAEMAKMLQAMTSQPRHTLPVPPVKYHPNLRTDAIIDAVVGDTQENYLFSPLSLKAAFGLAANGAKGDTQKEILDALGIEDLAIFNASIRGSRANYVKASDVVTLELNNSIWANVDQMGNVGFKEEYKSLLAEYYGAEAGSVHTADAADTINRWISEKTRGKIKNCIDSGDFSTALINTLYFKGAWKHPFRKEATKKETFTQADGKKVQTDLMHMTEFIPYYQKGSTKMIRLPYETLLRDENGNRKGDGPFVTLSMYVILSDEPVQMAALIDEVKDEMTEQKVVITLPKFSFKSKFELKGALQELGIQKAFTDQADFSDMSEIPQCISDVIQSTFIAVDEEGTEAAAATVIMDKNTTAIGEDPLYYFTADRPFRFAIVDESSGEVLFAGAYNKVETKD